MRSKVKTRKRKLRTAARAAIARSKNKRGYDKDYLEVRNNVLARDYWTCQLCDTAGVRLEVHHITLYSKSTRLRKNKRNLISLCKKCHAKIRNKEDRYKSIFRTKVARNTERYKDNKKTRAQLIAELKKTQVLPKDFKEYSYKTVNEITKEKSKEHYLRKTWRDIKYRTTNTNSVSYKRYGGRGIMMHDSWLQSFINFKKYIDEHLGIRPVGYSIDRINNDGNYEPGNIRWESAAVQKQNNSQTQIDSHIVLVIWVLFHKYKWRQCDIMYKLALTSTSIVSGVVRFKSWKNITYPYRKIVSDKKTIDLIGIYTNENNM